MTNFLWIVLDDVGAEVLSPWLRGGAGTYPYPSTPNINALVAAGMRFDRAYSAALCSPFRARAQTGRQAQRTGIGDIVRDDNDGPTSQIPLSLGEVTLAKLFHDAGYATGGFGKWHLGNTNAEGRRHPNLMGFDVYAGNLFNLDGSTTQTVNDTEFRTGYYAWNPTVQGLDLGVCRTYHPTAVTNWALRWLRDQTGPWFCYVPYFSVHAPFNNRSNLTPPTINAPPTSLYDSATWTAAQDSPVGAPTTTQTMHAWRAGIEAVDHEIGRLIAGVDLATTVVCICTDNGSPNTTIVNEQHPTLGLYTNHGKDSPYETGIWCAMAWRGPGISVGTHSGITAAEDIFATTCDLFDLPIPDDRGIDGISFASALAGGAGTRTTVYSEYFTPLSGPQTGDVGKTIIEWACVGPTNQGRYALVKNGISAALEFYELVPGGVVANYDPMQSVNKTPGGSTSGLSAGELSAFNALLARRAVEITLT